MLIKAGTYRFNDVLTAPPNDEVRANINFTVTATVGSDTFTETFYSISVYFDGDSLEFLYWDKDHLGSTQPYSNGWPEYEGCQFITIPNDTEVSSEFYEWFTANAVEQKEISGKWKFKDEITAPAGGVFSGGVNFTTESLGYIVHCNDLYVGEYPEMTYVVDSAPAELEQYLGSLGVTLPWPFLVVNGGTWDTDFYGEGVKTIDFGAESQYVSAEFYEWLTANALKNKEISGKWKFNDVLTYAGYNEVAVNFTAAVPLGDMVIIGQCDFLTYGYNLNIRVVSSAPDISAMGFPLPLLLSVYDPEADIPWEYDLNYIDFGAEPQSVSADFYNWMNANAVPAMASITHNGSTIAELFPGQTATLKCKGMKMEDDVVVEVAEMPESGGSGGESGVTVVPLTVTENGVYDGKIDTEVWDSNTEYAWTATYNGLTLSIKKAEKLTVPNDLNELTSSRYTAQIEIDGTTSMEELTDRIGIRTDGVCATWNDYSVLWVKNAAPLNAMFGVSFLEDNTVYVTNYLQLIQSAYHGAEYVKVSLTSFSEKANKAYCPITVNVTSAVVGVWKFNDGIIGKPFTEKVNFTADYVVGDSIELYAGIALEEDAASNYLYFLNANGVMYPVYSAVIGWRNGINEQISALTIDFGSDPQVVSATFKEWLQQNARPIYTITQTE